jgi:co-chaperonin GroES (HSP10)
MIRPLATKIAVKRIASEKQTSGGIILQSSEEPDRAEILALGPDVTQVEIGDQVLLNWNGAMKSGEEGVFVVDIEHVVLIYGDE